MGMTHHFHVFPRKSRTTGRKGGRGQESPHSPLSGSIMEQKGIEYKVLDDQTADVYAEMNFSEMAELFARENASILTMEEHDESLEAFYLALLGGEEHA